MVVYQALELRRPGLQILYFVEEEERRCTVTGGLVEGATKPSPLKPIGNGKQRLGKLVEIGEFVERQIEDPVASNTLVEQRVEHLAQKHRFPDPARTTQHHGWRDSALQPSHK